MLHELQPGDPQLIGPYRLRGRLGAGGMGQVFLGLSAGGRAVAVKVIRADLATDPEFRARFRREVAVARQVSGLFTAPVIDAELDGAVPWLATAYVGGPSLAEAVSENGPLPTGSVLALAAGLAEGLNAIHAAGVVHRDLKPANVLLAADGPRVIDFGISRAAGNSALTHTGLVVGSPGFMSPEQAEGREVGPPSDIFSLGAVLAFAATGGGPFGTGSTPALVYRVVHSPAQLDRLPAEIRPLVERCLAKDPGQRPTAADLLAGRVQPAAGWLPDTVTRTFIAVPALAAPLTHREEAGQPPRRENQPPRHRPRNRWRPLAAAVIVAGLLGASATAGFALTATNNRSHAGRGQTAAGARSAPAAATSAQASSGRAASAQAPLGRASSPAPSGPWTSSTPAGTPSYATTAPSPGASPTPTASSTSPSPGTSSPASTSSAPATYAPTTSAGY